MRKPEQPPTLQMLAYDKISEAFANDAYWAAVRQIERKYYHWAKVKYVAKAKGLDPELLWAMTKMTRQGKYRSVPLVGDGGSPIRYTVPDVLQEELMLIDQQLAGHLVTPDDQPISQYHQERFVINALREEAIASSMLEGAVTTRQEAKQMLRTGRKPRTRGELMVLNNYHAISFIREHKNTPLTPDFIIDVQRILTDGTLDQPDHCGRFRTEQDDVWVGNDRDEVMHLPPHASELQDRLERLCAFANDSLKPDDFMHPVIKACILHFQTGFDHPFCDGNGRTARALFYWSMLRSGYWLFEYLPISVLIYQGPSKYAMAYLYTETDAFDVTYFLVYHARIIRRARQDLAKYIESKQREMSDARRVFASDARLNHRQRELVLRMMRSPYMSVVVTDHQGRHQIAYGTARSDLLKLAEWGYLTQRSLGNKFVFERGPGLEQRGD